MEREPLQLRLYGAGLGDYQELSSWWFERHKEPFPEALLPPDSVMVCRGGKTLAMLSVYLSYGIGVAFLEFAVTRPGLGIKDAREALEAALEGCIALAHSRGDYSIFRCSTIPAIGRFLKSLGFVRDSTDRQNFTLRRDKQK